MTPLALALVLAAPITLDEVRAASKNNLDALRAEIDVRKAQSGVTLARAPIWPQLQFGAQVGGSATSDQVTVLPLEVNGTFYSEQKGFAQGRGSLNFTVSQLIYDGGRWWNAIAQAGAQQRAAEGQLSEQRLASELEAVTRFYELLRSQISVDVFENSVRRSQTQVERAKILFEAARAPKLDEIDAEVNLGNDRIALLRQKQVVVQSQVQLLKWLGQLAREIEAQDPGVDEPKGAPPIDRVLSVAKEKRPLLAALQAQVDAEQRAVDVAWSAFLPQVSLNGQYQRASPAVEPFFAQPAKQNYVSGGLTLQWNLFNGFQTSAQVDQARESLSFATLQRDRAAQDLEGDLRVALFALSTRIDIARISAANLKLAEATLKLAEDRFSAGAGSTLEVRDAQVKLTAAQLERVRARIDVELARATLRRVAGADVEETP